MNSGKSICESIATETLPRKRLWGPTPSYPNVERYIPPFYEKPITIAGSCSVESIDMAEKLAKFLAKIGIKYMRGGIFRAGTYPNPKMKFGFIDENVIAEYSRVAHDYGMEVIMEVLDYSPDALLLYDKYSDAYQVGARQMQNYKLLDILARRKRPVFLKRNMGATLDEFLGSAEWILRHQKAEIFLIERGSSTFHNHVRWDLSISMIAAIKKITNIPILVDASHGTGRRDLVEPMTLAGIAAGADGYLVETHPMPDFSISDPQQAVDFKDFQCLHTRVSRVHEMLKILYE